MKRKYILLLCLAALLIIAALVLCVYWIMEASEYAGYENDYADIAQIAIVEKEPAASESMSEPTVEEDIEISDSEAEAIPEGTAEPADNSGNGSGSPAPERVAVDFDVLMEQNSDTVGWLYIPGTKINYPVVQAENNDYYLTRSFKKKEASCGALFMDYQNGLNPLDQNTIVYGHNMGSSSSLMFSSLLKYKKQSYWEEHQTLQFDTPYRTGSWRILAVCHEDISTLEEFNFLRQDFISDDDFLSFVQTLKGGSMYDAGVSVSPEDRLLTLVTCDRSGGLGKNGRLIVVAKQIG